MSRLRLALRLPLVVGLLLGGLFTVLLLFPLGGPRFHRAAIRRWSRMLVGACGVTVVFRGSPQAALLADLPAGSFVVSNHVSWMDIFVINSQCPAAFVAKAEIAAWPLVGTLVARTGNLFIERGKRHAVHRLIEHIGESLNAGGRVAVFPEGTTSDGLRLLPFHANLVQAAVRAQAPVVPVGLRYFDRAGQPSQAIQFVGDTTFVDSMMAVLSAPGVRCELHVQTAIADPALSRHDIVEQARAALAQSLALPLDDTLPDNLRALRRG